MTAKEKLISISQGNRVNLIDVNYKSIIRYCSHSLPCFDGLFLVDSQLIHESQLTGRYYASQVFRNILPLPSSESDVLDPDSPEPTQYEIIKAFVKSGDIKREHLPVMENHLQQEQLTVIKQLLR